jgi:hypothetical protein
VNGNLPIAHDPLAWLAPSPLWDGGAIGFGETAVEQPRVVEMTTDQFVPELLGYLAGNDPAGLGPRGLFDHRAPAHGGGTYDDPQVLYQPIHQRYYFVLGSLVCRRVGLPDRTVAPRGERVSFVIRRVDEAGDEQAWMPGAGTWVDAPDPSRLVGGEERLPMQTAPVGVATASGPAAELLGLDRPGLRQLHFGFVPVAGRTTNPAILPDAAAVDAVLNDAEMSAGDDPRLMAFRLRIAGAWNDLAARKDTVVKAGGNVSRLHLEIPSLFVLLDLRDWLTTYLPSVLNALVANDPLPAGGREELRKALNINVRADTAPKPLREVLDELESYVPLLVGDDSVGTPPATYDLSAPLPDAARDTYAELSAYIDSLGGTGAANGGLVAAALAEEDGDPDGEGEPVQVPVEMQGTIVAAATDPATSEDRHVLRLVYEHDPCAPVLSKPSAVVRFAGLYDPDAPARKVRIPMPDPSNLRRFNRGVAIEVPPKLRKILDGVSPRQLKEEPPGEGGDWGVGMVCMFSFQIFFLLSFIIAFIFLIVLNIVFWWLAFIKICFPIPVKKS